MMLEMRVYIEKRHKSREIEQPGVWFKPPIDYDELEERIGVTDQEPDYVIRDYELPFEIDEDMMIEELNIYAAGRRRRHRSERICGRGKG